MTINMIKRSKIIQCEQIMYGFKVNGYLDIPVYMVYTGIHGIYDRKTKIVDLSPCHVPVT